MKNDYIKKRCVTPLIISAIIFSQCVLIIHFGLNKPDLFVDEWWSFSLACGNIPFIGDASQYFNIPLPQSFWIDAVSVTPDKIFDFTQVWDSQAKDVHPPFYYVLLHIMRGILNGEFNYMPGIYLNIIFFILTQVLLFKITKKITNSKRAGIVTIVFYGFSLGGISSVVFIRMYMMLTFFVLLNLYLTIKILSKNTRKINKFLVILFLLTHILGFLTQYYYAIYAFFSGIFLIIWKFLFKKYQEIIIYVVASLCAILMSYLIFPSWINHIVGGGEEPKRLAIWKR